jgi:DNA-binding CsgD family transcriptional regulator
MVEGLCALVGARQGAALHWDGFSPKGTLRLLEFVPGGHWEWAAAPRLWESLLQQPNWRGDPILDAATRVDGAVVTRRRTELVSDPKWYASEAANVVAKRAGIDPHMVCWYRRARGAADEVRGVALHRAWGDSDFTEHDRQLFHLFNEELFRLDRDGKLDPPPDPAMGLTPRQREVLLCTLQGDSEKEAARRLGVSRFTLNDHVKAIYRRLGVSSRGELLARFIPARS